MPSLDILPALYALQESPEPRKVCVDLKKGVVMLDWGPVLVGVYDQRIKYAALRKDILHVWPSAVIAKLGRPEYCQRGHLLSVHVNAKNNCTLCVGITYRARQSASVGRSRSSLSGSKLDKRPTHQPMSAREERLAHDRARSWSEN